MGRHILHVDLDAFFAAVEQAENPEFLGKPVIVGGVDGRGVVATASYEARKFGVHSAMPIRTAQRLAPHAIYLPGRFGVYQEYSKRFHKILADYTPLMESWTLDEAYLDVTGCEPIIGSPEEAAVSIRARIRTELKLPASVGIASSKVVAKVASDRAKPDGICIVPEGEEAEFLAPMPLRGLPMLGPSTEKRLASLGISTLGQLAAVPAERLEGLLGPHGAIVGQRARGIDPSSVGYGEHVAKSISREGTFSADVVNTEQLRVVLRSFSESVGRQLRKSGRRARTVSLKLRFEDFTTLNRSVSLKSGRSLSSDEAIFNAADGMLSRIRKAEQRPVRLIGVGVSNLIDGAVQLSLEPTRESKADSISAAMDKVRVKFERRDIIQTGRTAFQSALRGDRGEWDAEGPHWSHFDH